VKELTIAILLITLALLSSGQNVPSSCTAQESIIEKYQPDADRLAVRRIFQDSLAYMDSIEIPQSHTDTFLNALIAIYNAFPLAARDTVVDIFDIHSFPRPIMNSFDIAADSNLYWMQKLRNEELPTGHPTIDSLAELYNLSIENYSTYSGSFIWHIVTFGSDENYNLLPLVNIYNSIQGVFSAEPSGIVGDGNDITSTLYPSYIELIFSVGWGDCPAGCTERRYWKFKVYLDCSVDYIESYGSPLTISLAKDNELNQFSIKPNPASNQVIIESNLKGHFEFKIFNSMGILVKEGTSLSNESIELEEFDSGIYIVSLLKEGEWLASEKLVLR